MHTDITLRPRGAGTTNFTFFRQRDRWIETLLPVLPCLILVERPSPGWCKFKFHTVFQQQTSLIVVPVMKYIRQKPNQKNEKTKY